MKKVFSKKVSAKKKRQYKFRVDQSKLSTKNKELITFEDNLLSRIKRPLVKDYGGKPPRDDVFLNRLHRGNWNNYYDIKSLNSLLYDSIVNYSTSWYMESSVFSYIHDVSSIKTPPDYRVMETPIGYNNSVNILLKMFIDYSISKGVRRISNVKYKCAVEWLTIYLYQCNGGDYLALKYARDNSFRNKYGVKDKNFSMSSVLRLVDMLISELLVLPFTGNVLYGERVMSMIVISPDLYEILQITNKEETKVKTVRGSSVVIRDNENNEIVLSSLPVETMRVLDEGVSIVDSLNNHFKTRLVTINGYTIPEVFFRRIHREDMEICSRLFDDGSVQGKSKVLRSLIKIDNENTVSLDFKSIHPAILLFNEGVSLSEHDPYPSNVGIDIDKELIYEFKQFYSLEEYNPIRTLVKKLLLCLINAESKQDAVGACYKALQRDNLKRGTYHEHRMDFVGIPNPIDLHTLADVLIIHNKPIAQYLGCGEGVKLQRVDSDIIMRCIDILIKENIAIIPIHDALICKESTKERVEQVMAESFVAIVGKGSEVNCIIEEE